MRETEDLRLVGHAAVAPHLLGPAGGVRTGALLTMIDNVGGLNGGLAALPEGWVVSTNLAARVVELAHVGPLRIDSSVLRRGRNNVVTGVQIHDEGAHDALVASGVLTSAILVPENGPPQWSRPVVLEPPAGVPNHLPVDPGLARRARRRRSRGRDRPRRPAAQSVGHSPRWCRRDARRPRGRTRDRAVRTRLTSCCTSSHPTASGRCVRSRVRSVSVPMAQCSGSKSATKAPTAPPPSRSSPRRSIDRSHERPG